MTNYFRYPTCDSVSVEAAFSSHLSRRSFDATEYLGRMFWYYLFWHIISYSGEFSVWLSFSYKKQNSFLHVEVTIISVLLYFSFFRVLEKIRRKFRKNQKFRFLRPIRVQLSHCRVHSAFLPWIISRSRHWRHVLRVALDYTNLLILKSHGCLFLFISIASPLLLTLNVENAHFEYCR